MAFNTAPGRAEYTASASQTAFPISFKIYTTADVKVYQTLAGADADDATDILILDTDYTVTINGDLGGQIDLIVGAAVSDNITIVRELDIDRMIEYQTSGDLLASTLNLDQNYQSYLIADREAKEGRFLTLPSSSQGIDSTLPPPEALYYLRWDASGTALENSPVEGSGLPSEGNVAYVTTIADLSLLDVLENSVADIKGYTVANDGGGGIFVYDPALSATNNGGTIIDGWVRQYAGNIFPEWFGADNTGVADSASAINAALAVGSIELNTNSTYLCASTITLPTRASILGGTNSVIEYTGSDICISNEHSYTDAERCSRIENITIITATEGTGTGIKVFRTDTATGQIDGEYQSLILSDVKIICSANGWWARGLHALNIGGVSSSDLYITNNNVTAAIDPIGIATGIRIENNVANANIIRAFTASGLYIYTASKGIEIEGGSQVESVYIDKYEIVACCFGITVNVGRFLAAVSLSGGHMDCTHNAIYAPGIMSDLKFTGTNFRKNPWAGVQGDGPVVQFDWAREVAISGCTFTCEPSFTDPANVGIDLARLISSSVTGNTFYECYAAYTESGTWAGGGNNLAGNTWYNNTSEPIMPSLTWVINETQVRDGDDTIFMKRATDTAPAGQFIRCTDAANTVNIFTVDVNANLSTAGNISTTGGAISVGTTLATGGTYGLEIKQKADGDDCIHLERNINSGSTGYFLYCDNADSTAARATIDTVGNFWTKASMNIAGGSTTQDAGVFSLGNTQSTTATAGAAGALPATPSSYWTIQVGASVYKIPMYNA